MFQFLLFMICEMILIYLFLFLYGRYPKKWIYFGALFCSMIPIILIKLCVYTRFDMLGFVGISYISFRIWQMIIEIRDGHIKKILLLDTLYFITFFPTLSSGPIDRYQRFMSDLNQVIPKKEYLHSYLAAGLRKILRGMIYKFGFAFLIQYIIMDHLPVEHTIQSTVIYMYAYTFYLFFDFAGYSNFCSRNILYFGNKSGREF